MSSPIIMFVAFSIFLLCQYAIWVVSNFIGHYFGLTGRIYWCTVIVAFLILNELCFGAYDFAIGSMDDDEEEYDWVDE